MEELVLCIARYCIARCRSASEIKLVGGFFFYKKKAEHEPSMQSQLTNQVGSSFGSAAIITSSHVVINSGITQKLTPVRRDDHK